MLYYPLDTALVSEWPGDRGGWWHYGTDFAVPVDTPLHASFDGVVVFAGGDGASGSINGVYANGEGLTVDLQRSDGLIARYGHLNSVYVTHGQHVKAGQVIALSGNTGFTTGPHCHWELRWDRAWTGGKWADPRTLGARQIGEIVMTPAQEKKVDALRGEVAALRKEVAGIPVKTLAYKVTSKSGLKNNLSTLLKREARDHSWRKRVAANDTARWAWLRKVVADMNAK